MFSSVIGGRFTGSYANRPRLHRHLKWPGNAESSHGLCGRAHSLKSTQIPNVSIGRFHDQSPRSPHRSCEWPFQLFVGYFWHVSSACAEFYLVLSLPSLPAKPYPVFYRKCDPVASQTATLLTHYALCDMPFAIAATDRAGLMQTGARATVGKNQSPGNKKPAKRRVFCRTGEPARSS